MKADKCEIPYLLYMFYVTAYDMTTLGNGMFWTVTSLSEKYEEVINLLYIRVMFSTHTTADN